MNPNALRLLRWKHRVKSWMWGQRQRLFRAIVRWLDRKLKTGLVFEKLDTFRLLAGRALTIAYSGEIGEEQRCSLIPGDTLDLSIHTFAGGKEFPIPTTVIVLTANAADEYLKGVERTKQLFEARVQIPEEANGS